MPAMPCSDPGLQATRASELSSFQWDFAQVDALRVYCGVVSKHLQRVIALRTCFSFLFFLFLLKKGTKNGHTAKL